MYLFVVDSIDTRSDGLRHNGIGNPGNPASACIRGARCGEAIKPALIVLMLVVCNLGLIA
ncbi:hypothetical protein AAF134_08100 [Synechococcus lacustris Tous-12m]